MPLIEGQGLLRKMYVTKCWSALIHFLKADSKVSRWRAMPTIFSVDFTSCTASRLNSAEYVSRWVMGCVRVNQGFTPGV